MFDRFVACTRFYRDGSDHTEQMLCMHVLTDRCGFQNPAQHLLLKPGESKLGWISDLASPLIQQTAAQWGNFTGVQLLASVSLTRQKPALPST